MKYEVTIGIPVYHAERYIRPTLESVLAQTFQHMEILIVDDCGTDGTMDIIREYQQNHPRGNNIHIVRQPHNKGIGEGRNRIIDEAAGRYLYFMDADDTIEPGTIELLYEHAQRYRAEIVYGSYERVELYGEEVKHLPTQFEPRQFLNGDEFASWAYAAYGNLPAMTWNFLIDIEVFRKNALRYQPVNYWEDFTMTMDLPTYITRAVLLPDVTYHYFCRNDSASNFQKRDHIDKQEILKTIGAMAAVKNNSERLKDKPYFPQRMMKVMKTHYFMCQSILHNRKIITPSFSRREIRDIMRSPLTLREILSLKDLRMKNLILYSLGVMPPAITVAFIKMFSR